MNAVTAYGVVEVGVHQLWMSALIAGLVGAGLWLRTRPLRRRLVPVSAESRYWLWYCALIVMAALPLAVLIPKGALPQVQVAPFNPLQLERVQNDRVGDERASSTAPARLASNQPAWIRAAAVPFATTVLALWAAITMWRLVRLSRGLATLRRWRRDASVITVPMDLECEVRESPTVATPMVVGILDPCVLLPAGLRSQLTPEQLEHVLAHELEHIRRRDPLFALVQRIIEAIYFYNPAVRWVSRIVDHERECSCDDRVLANGRDGSAYADSLLSVARLVVGAPAPAEAMAAVGHRLQLAQRIERLLERENGGKERMSWFTVGSITSVVVAAAVLLAPSVPLAKGQAVTEGREEAGSARASSQRLALVEAIARGDDETTDELLRAGTDINIPVRGDGTPLIVAARSGNRSLVRRLLASGADVNLASRGDGNALINAAAHGDFYIVKQLVEHGADVNGYVPGDETPLINASAHGHVDIVNYLVERGADVNLAVPRDESPDSELRSPLSEARSNEMVKLLKSLGARN